MDIATIARTRHTAKAFDPARKIPEAVLAEPRDWLRHSPSYINSQPWHFIVAGSEAGKARIAYLDLHRSERQDLRPWLEKQVYLALGPLLIAVAALGLDACPMEGFDSRALDEEFGLTARGLASVALVALGYRGTGDWNARLPKSRLPAGVLFIEL